MPLPNAVSEFGLRLRSDREAAGMTVRQLADAASISYSYITKIEAARPASGISVEIVRALAYALGADELEYINLSRVLPKPLRHLLSTPESRLFVRATLKHELSADDWEAVTLCLERRVKKASSRQRLRSDFLLGLGSRSGSSGC